MRFRFTLRCSVVCCSAQLFPLNARGRHQWETLPLLSSTFFDYFPLLSSLSGPPFSLLICRSPLFRSLSPPLFPSYLLPSVSGLGCNSSVPSLYPRGLLQYFWTRHSAAVGETCIIKPSLIRSDRCSLVLPLVSWCRSVHCVRACPCPLSPRHIHALLGCCSLLLFQPAAPLPPQKHELLLRASVNCLSSLLGFLQRRSPPTGTSVCVWGICAFGREMKVET